MDKKRDDCPDRTRVYGHYGLTGDYECIKSGKLGAIDIHIVREEELKQLTADMAGFGMAKSQRIIIDYDKGYGWAIVKRILTDQGQERS